MTRTRRWLTATGLAAIAACVTLLALSSQAQPPGFKGKFGFGKGDGGAFKSKEGDRRDERKDGERKEGERRDGERKEGERKDSERKEGGPQAERPPAAERIRQLERELAETQARLHRLVQELIQAHIELAQEQMGRGGPFGPMGPGFGGPRFGGPFFPGGPGGVPGGPGGPGGPRAAQPGFVMPPVERMTPEQIKEAIQRLQRALEERMGERREAPKTREGAPRKEKESEPATERAELLKRIEKMRREVEELRRSLEQQKK